MSRNSVLLGRAGVNTMPPPREAHPLENVLQSGIFLALIRRLFNVPSVVAVGGSVSGDMVREVCNGIAAELANSGRRVVIVPVATALAINPTAIPDETQFVPGKTANTWIWPPSSSSEIEFYKFPKVLDEDSWVGVLRRDFDAVLLDCPDLGTTSGVADVMALADAGVLLVEDGKTSRRQLEKDQQSLERRGAKLSGCILVKRR
jgi:hypothetical protein